MTREERRAALLAAMSREFASLSAADKHALMALHSLARTQCPGTDPHHEGFGLAGLAISPLYCDRCIMEAIARAWESGHAAHAAKGAP